MTSRQLLHSPQQSSSVSSKLKNHRSGKEILYLEKSHVKFQSPSQNLNLYLDECNKEIISITRSQETNLTNVLIQPIFERRKLKLNLPIRKKILCLKLNPDRSILAYHVEQNIVEFLNLKKKTDDEYAIEGKQYVRACNTKNSKFYGFFWTGLSDVVFVTDISVEYYHVDSSRQRLKHIKSFASTTNWFIYQPNHTTLPQNFTSSFSGSQHGYSVLMVSFGTHGSDVQPYMFASREIRKMMSFEVEGNWRNSNQLERSVTISRIYGYVRLLVLQHSAPNPRTKGSRILVYTLDIKNRMTSKTHVLDFDTSGYFALNIVDDLIIGHHQASKTSFIFDIMAKSTEKSDCPNQFVSLDQRTIRQLYREDIHKEAELYSQNWVFIQPDFIINPEVGHLMILKLDLDLIPELLCDNLVLLDFLTHRTNSEFVIFKKIKEILLKCHEISIEDKITTLDATPLTDISSVFEIISHITESSPSRNSRPSEVNPNVSGAIRSDQTKVSLIQEEFHQHVFKCLNESQDTSFSSLNFIISALFEYIFVLRSLDKIVSFVIYEQLIKFLLKSKMFYQIVRMMRTKILQDSKQLACLLLSIKKEYPAANQLGLDMLTRLNIAADDSMIRTLTSLMDERCHTNDVSSEGT